jgi:hypothetical protein
VRVEKDTIAFTETSKIFVQAKDAENQDIDLDGSTVLKLELLGEWAYGTFIKPNGDTLKTTPVELENILYDDARSGKVQVAAVAANPEVSAQPLVHVSLMSDPTKSGEQKITVVEQRLRIVIVGPSEVFPLIPPFTPLNPNRENTTVLEIRLTRGGRPVADHPISLMTDYVDGSGGHDHVSPRRARSFENYGHLVSTRTNERNNPIPDITGADGKASFGYVASQFGDRMKIRVESTRNRLLWDTTSIGERVPDLQELPTGRQYQLVGAPDNHTGTNDPCRDASSLTSLHYRNHYGTSRLVQAIRNIAAAYDSLNPGIRLRINDMSLKYGGLFDIGNRWLQGSKEAHAEHRIGENADIGFSGIDSGNHCTDISPDDLLPLIERYTLGQSKRHDDHYHIRIR